MNFVEKLESWRWIKPIPTKLPKKTTMKSAEQKRRPEPEHNSSRISFTTFTSHLREWQKEQKYTYNSRHFSDNPVSVSAFSSGLAKSVRKFKSGLDRAADKIKTNFTPRRSVFREKAHPVKEERKVTLLYETKSRKNPFRRLDDNDDGDDFDDDDVYLVPKSQKFVTFADSFSSVSSSSTFSNSVSSIAENLPSWPWSVFYIFLILSLEHD